MSPVSASKQPCNSRFRRVARKKHGRIPDLGALLERNTLEFRIWACCLEETGRISRFGRVAWKKYAGFPDLGVLLGRNRAEFPIWARYLEETRWISRFGRVAWKKLAGFPERRFDVKSLCLSFVGKSLDGVPLLPVKAGCLQACFALLTTHTLSMSHCGRCLH